MQQQQRREQPPTTTSSQQQQQSNNVKSGRLRKLVYCLPDPLKENIIENEEAYTKMMINTLANAVQLRDEDVLSHAFDLLGKYRQIMRFKPEERVSIIKMCIRLVDVSNNWNIVFGAVDILIKLMKDFKLPTKDIKYPNLVIDWEPLFKVFIALNFHEDRQNDSFKDSLEKVSGLIKLAKYFFPYGSTPKILEVIRSSYSFRSSSVYKAQGLMTLFLPTHTDEYKIWFDDMMKMIPWFSFSIVWNAGWMKLLSDLVKDQYGKIDWTPYLDMIFTIITRFLNLPVGRNNVENEALSKYTNEKYSEAFFVDDPDVVLFLASGVFIGYALDPKGECQKRLSKFLKNINVYFHPSNSGDWCDLLYSFIMGLSLSISNRIKKDAKTNPCPDFKLTPQNIDDFVLSMMDIVKLAQFTKSDDLFEGVELLVNRMSYIRPQLVIPPLMEYIIPGLETVTETHQTTHAIGLLRAIGRTLASKEKYPDGAKYLKSLLPKIIPGIDINDPEKTINTFTFIMSILQCIHLSEIDINIYDMENDEDKEWIELTKLFEDWTMQLLDKVLYIYSSRTKSESRVDVLHYIGSAFLKNFFMSMGQHIYDLALEKVFKFVTTNMLPDILGQVRSLVHFACLPHPEKSVHIFIDYCLKKLVAPNGTPLKLSKEECQWLMTIATGSARMIGSALVPLKDKLISIAIAGFSNGNPECTTTTGIFVRDILTSLGYTYVFDTRPFTKGDMESPDFTRTHYKYWGKTYSLKTAKISWHIPTEEETEVAGEIANLFITTSMSQMREILSGKFDNLPSPVNSSPTMTGSPSPTLSSTKNVSLPLLPKISLGKSVPIGGRMQFGASFAYKTPTRFQLVRKSPEVSDVDKMEVVEEEPSKKITKIEKSTSYSASISALSVEALKTGPAKMSLKRIIVNILGQLEWVLVGATGLFMNEYMTKDRYAEELSAALASGDWRRQYILTPPFPDVTVLLRRPKSLTVTVGEVCDFIHDTFLKIVSENSPYTDNQKIAQALASLISEFLDSSVINISIEARSAKVTNKILSDYARDPLNTSKETHIRANISEKVFNVIQNIFSNALDNSPFTRIHDILIKDILTFLFGPFSEASLIAKRSFHNTLIRFPYRVRGYYDEIFSVLMDSDAPDYKILSAAENVKFTTFQNDLFLHPQYLHNFLRGVFHSIGVQPENVQWFLRRVTEAIIGAFGITTVVPLHCIPNSEMEGLLATLSKGETSFKIPDEAIHLIDAKKDEESRNKVQALNKTIELLSEIYTKVAVPQMYLYLVPNLLIYLSITRGFTPSKTMVDIALKCSVSNLPDVNSSGWRLLTHVISSLKNTLKERNEMDLCDQDDKTQFRYLTKEEFDIDYYTLPVPSSESEWEKTILVDKPWDGWNGIKYPGKAYKQRFCAQIPESPENEPEVVMKYLTDKLQKYGFPTMLKNTILGHRKEDDHFSIKQACLWKYLSIIAQKDLFDEMKPIICELITDVSYTSNQTVASEAFAGIIRGSKKWPFEMQQEMWKEATQILELAAKECPSKMFRNWTSAITFISYHMDPRRLHWATDWSLEKLRHMTTCETSSLYEVSKCITIVARSFNMMNWKANSLSESFLELLESIMSKSYEQIGKRISDGIHIAIVRTWRRKPRVPGDTKSWDMEYQPVISDKKKNFLLRVLESPNFDILRSMTPDDLGDPKFQPCLNFVNTTICFIIKLAMDSTIVSDEVYKFLIKSLRLLFSLLNHPSDQIKSSLEDATTFLAYKQFPEYLLPDVVDVICDFLDHEQWHIREEVLPFLEIFIYQNSFRLSKDLQKRLLEKLVKLLGDPQIEVSISASITFAGVLKIVDSAYEEKCCNTFAELAETKLPNKNEVTEAEFAESLRKRHSGIFGLSSVLGAHTYDLPPWMPDVLLKFARHVNDPEPIRNTAKSSVMEFWRTHSDMWDAEFVHMFTSEQLNELHQLLVAPSYFV